MSLTPPVSQVKKHVLFRFQTVGGTNFATATPATETYPTEVREEVLTILLQYPRAPKFNVDDGAVYKLRNYFRKNAL